MSLTPFMFPDTGQPVRVVSASDGAPWFVGRDVALALGYSNPGKAVRDHVPAAHKRGTDSFTPSDLHGFDPQTVLISEPGLYRLIMRSHTPAAEAFQEWVTAIVLPSLRRTGSFSLDQAPRTYAEALRALADQHEAAEVARAEVAELTPSATAWETLSEAGGDYSLREAAQVLDRDPLIETGQHRLARLLRELGWCGPDGQPYQRHVDRGRLVRRTRTYPHPRTGAERVTTQLRVTARGVRELRDVLIERAQTRI